MKIPRVALTPAERARACELWQELKCAEGARAQEKVQQKLRVAPWAVQQAVMREALAQICGRDSISRGGNPFGDTSE